ILDVLGKGGMGVVYKAQDQRLKRFVAIKMIKGSEFDADEHERFQREAEAVAKLDHPNIVKIFGIDKENDQPYFVLEFVDGGSLGKHLKGTPQAPTFCAKMIETLARAIHHAHQQNIIHRDLKPANILLHRMVEDTIRTSAASMSQSIFLVRQEEFAF